jgi:thymidylate synthase (FAD)
MIKVDYINHMGNDLTVVRSARVSFGAKTETTLTSKDRKLIDYLAKHKHMSPFEHCQLTVKIACPLYIRSQIHRHRTFSYNEISRRYTDKDLEFFIPETIRKQSENNRQASSGTLDKQQAAKDVMKHSWYYTKDFYNTLIKMGVPREQARGILPTGLMTEFYMSGNLRNWAHFVGLRDHEGAQGEVQEVAVAIKAIIKDKFPISYEALEKTDD